MIALPSLLPLLRIGRYELATYEAHWLEQSIQDAAREAGNDEKWWFASDIVRSLMIYLRDRFPGTTITLEELSAKISSTLEKVGFGEIGHCMRLHPPGLTLSVIDLAREAGEGFELQFFQLLDARLQEMTRLGVRHIALTDSHDGVKHLRSAKYWTQSCRELEEEIVQFLRTRARLADDCRIELFPH